MILTSIHLSSTRLFIFACIHQQGKFSESEGKALLEYLSSSSYVLEERECLQICQRALDKAFLTQDSAEHMLGLNCNLELCLKLSSARP